MALNYCMRDHGGFEGNGQTLRILSWHENFSRDAGANLARRTMLGVLKYPVAYSVVRNPAITPHLVKNTTTIKLIDGKSSKPPKCFLDSETDVVSWIFEPLSSTDREKFQSFLPQSGKHAKAIYKSLDCSIMDVADDIAYGVHDLEDAIALGLIKEKTFRNYVTEESCRCFLDTMNNDPKNNNKYDILNSKLFGDGNSRKHYISKIVHNFVTNVVFISDDFAEPMLKYRVALKEEQRIFLDSLQELISQEVIKSASVQHLEFKGQTMVVSVFEAIAADPERLLPDDFRRKFLETTGDTRVICDFIAGMTDHHLLKTYDRLFSPRMGSVFDKL